MTETVDTGIAERVSAITQVDPYHAEQLTQNRDAFQELLSFVIELDADMSYPIGGDMDEVLRESITLVPNISVSVYDREHDRYDYMMILTVGNTVYSAVTFAGAVDGVIEYLLRQLDESVGTVDRIRDINTPPEEVALKGWLADINDGLGSMDLDGAIDSSNISD